MGAGLQSASRRTLRPPRTTAFARHWPECRVIAARLDHAGKSGLRVVSAFIATAFAQGEAGQRLIRWINRPLNAGLRLCVTPLNFTQTSSRCHCQ